VLIRRESYAYLTRSFCLSVCLGFFLVCHFYVHGIWYICVCFCYRSSSDSFFLFLFFFFFSALFSSVHLLFVYPVFGVLLLLFHILDRAPCILHHYTNQLITPTQKKTTCIQSSLNNQLARLNRNHRAGYISHHKYSLAPVQRRVSFHPVRALVISDQQRWPCWHAHSMYLHTHPNTITYPSKSLCHYIFVYAYSY